MLTTDWAREDGGNGDEMSEEYLGFLKAAIEEVRRCHLDLALFFQDTAKFQERGQAAMLTDEETSRVTRLDKAMRILLHAAGRDEVAPQENTDVASGGGYVETP